MRKIFKGVVLTVGLLMAAGTFGAALELFLNGRLHLTEPLAGWYWFWSFFHRAKFYAVLGAGAGGLFALGAVALAAVRRLFTKRKVPISYRRAFTVGAFAPAAAAAPVWFLLANVWVEVPEMASLGLAIGWLALAAVITFVGYRVGKVLRGAGVGLRRGFAVVGYAAAAAYAAGGIVSAATRPAPPAGLPDVVIITLDACRADEFGPRPDGTTLTPNIDRFAENAFVFTHCRSEASWTSPSLATLHTGQYPMVHYATAHRPLGTSQPTWAETMRDAGYETKAVVANRLCHRGLGLGRGFDDYLYWDQSRFVRALGYYETFFYYLENRALEKRNTRVGVKDDHTTVITDKIEKILARKRRRPLFLWVHYLDPHTPYSPPPEYVAPEDRRFIDKFWHGDRKRADVLKRLYDGEVRYVDDELGRVFAVMPEDALVIISSDHGEEFWEHGKYDHGKTLYDEVIRVPCVVRFPEGGRGVSDAAVSLIDFAPTVLSYLGRSVPASMQGRDIAPAARGEDWDYPAFAGSSMLAGMRRYCVVYRGRKLILGHEQAWAQAEYYDLAADPGEHYEGDRSQPEYDRLQTLLREWLEGNMEFSAQFERAGVSPALRDHMRAVGYIN
jgi:arylsulfatase A-like enzyme